MKITISQLSEKVGRSEESLKDLLKDRGIIINDYNKPMYISEKLINEISNVKTTDTKRKTDMILISVDRISRDTKFNEKEVIKILKSRGVNVSDTLKPLKLTRKLYNYIIDQSENIKKNDYVNNNINIQNEKINEYGGTSNGIIGNSKIFADNIVFNASQGHGYAAEKANDLIDRIKGENAKVIGGDLSKNGADRIVNGVKIQTKYCK